MNFLPIAKNLRPESKCLIYDEVTLKCSSGAKVKLLHLSEDNPNNDYYEIKLKVSFDLKFELANPLYIHFILNNIVILKEQLFDSPSIISFRIRKLDLTFFEIKIYNEELKNRKIENKDFIFYINLLGISDTTSFAPLNLIFIDAAINSCATLGLEGIYLKLDKIEKFRSKIIKSLKDKKPLSVIRLGDTEGRLLGYPYFFSSFDILLDVLNYQFGSASVELIKSRGDENAIDNSAIDLRQMLCTALEDADFVGLPVHDFFFQYEKDKKINRGILAYACSYHLGFPFLKKLNEENIVGVNVFQLLTTHTNFFKEIASYAESLHYVSQHNLDKVLSEVLEVEAHQIAISGHASFSISSEDPGQYPDNFLKTTNEIIGLGDLSGKLFLVGAGVLGKYFCYLIKKRGGVALDIGAVFDSWAGKGLPYAINNEVPRLESTPEISFGDFINS